MQFNHYVAHCCSLIPLPLVHGQVASTMGAAAAASAWWATWQLAATHAALRCKGSSKPSNPTLIKAKSIKTAPYLRQGAQAQRFSNSG
jgi:hypothetical protein